MKEITEEEFSNILRQKGFSDWDINVAIEGFRKGVVLNPDGNEYVIKKSQ